MKDEVRYHINKDSAVSVFEQIENQICFAIASGQLKPGDKLPAVNTMKEILDVNPNTVTKAYRDLGLVGMLRAQRGVGVSITDKAPKLARERAQDIVLQHLRDAVAEAIACGLAEDAINKIVRDTVKSKRQPYQG